MINDIVTLDATREAVIARLREYLGDFKVGQAKSLDAIADALLVFLDLDESEDRRLFIGGISAIGCPECGKPSCLHGYSDC